MISQFDREHSFFAVWSLGFPLALCDNSTFSKKIAYLSSVFKILDRSDPENFAKMSRGFFPFGILGFLNHRLITKWNCTCFSEFQLCPYGCAGNQCSVRITPVLANKTYWFWLGSKDWLRNEAANKAKSVLGFTGSITYWYEANCSYCTMRYVGPRSHHFLLVSILLSRIGNWGRHRREILEHLFTAVRLLAGSKPDAPFTRMKKNYSFSACYSLLMITWQM